MTKLLKEMSYTRLIALSFMVAILAGTILLMLPISARSGNVTPMLDALFTATSATCVIGFVVQDTFQYWSVFGQVVILALIQIGALGFVTLVSMFAIFAKKRIGLRERRILMYSSSNMRLSGMIELVKQIAAITFLCEGVGALLLAIQFVPELGWIRGIYHSIFHSVSAFCNAGFDLMGRYEAGSSLMHYKTNGWVLFVISLLAIIGGLGFTVWSDVLENRHNIRHYSLHSKVAIVASFVLLLVGWAGFFLFEYNGELAQFSMPYKLLNAFFMSAITRTAGFSTIDIQKLSPSGMLLTMIFMMIGGNPGSTAGGIKTTTIAVMIFAVCAMATGRREITVFKRRLDKDLIKHAGVILFVYIAAVLSATMMICAVEHLELTKVLFETCAAMGTTGLSQGVIGQVGTFSRIIFLILMYGGRIGGLSLLLVFAEKETEAPIKRPTEKIMIG